LLPMVHGVVAPLYVVERGINSQARQVYSALPKLVE
jgi:hypothetical protein